MLYVSGKWWGNKNEVPMIALHGWQDNANSFDTLAPLLNVSSFLAIDAPGHGLSSHLPAGKIYNFLEYVLILRRIVKHFNWEKFPIFGHSLGSAVAYVYSSLYPNEIKCFINFECARSLVMMYTLDLAYTYRAAITKILKIEKQLAENPAPLYRLSEMVKVYSGGSVGSITPESALILLKRAAYPVDNVDNYSRKRDKSEGKTDLIDLVNLNMGTSITPEKQEAIDKANARIVENIAKNLERLEKFKVENDDKWYLFTRDPKIKINGIGMFNEELLTECANNIKCPVLSMRANDGFLHGITADVFLKTNEIMKKNCYFEHHEVEGSHHGHLNNPENVAPVVNNFLKNINY